MSRFADLVNNLLQSYIYKEFAAYKKYVGELIEWQNEVLRSLSLVPPQLVSELEMTADRHRDGYYNVQLIPPKFEYPPHLLYVVKEGRSVLTLFGDPGEAINVYRARGLPGIGMYPQLGGVWTNRNPYGFFQAMAQKPATFRCEGKGQFAKLAQEQKYGFVHRIALAKPPLQLIPVPSVDETRKIHAVVRLFNSLTAGRFTNFRDQRSYYEAKDGASDNIPENILFDLPLAPMELNGYVGIKILPDKEIKPAMMTEFFQSLRAVNRFFAFEIVRTGKSVSFQIWCPPDCQAIIVEKMKVCFPGFALLKPDPIPARNYFNLTYLTKKSFRKSIRGLRDFQVDPYTHFLPLFETAGPDEIFCYQVLFAPLTEPAVKRLKNCLIEQRARLDEDYHSDFVKRLPLWLTTVTVSGTEGTLVNRAATAAANALGTPEEKLSQTTEFMFKNEPAFPFRAPMRGNLLQAEELAALAHFPVSQLPLRQLEQLTGKSVEPPPLYASGDVRLGEVDHLGQVKTVTLPEEVRDRHLYIVGKSGTGKSTLLETVVRHDIAAGRGVAVIDPHGDMIQHLLETLPPERVADCVLFSPKHCPVSLDILSADNEHEIDLLTDDLITMFRRTSEAWGDKMQAILQMTFQTLLRVRGSSFTDITPFLTDENFRNRILDRIDNPQLASFWRHRYEMKQAEPILIRMDRLTTSGTLRRVLTQDKNSLNFYDVITEGKIFLADLNKGFLGESTSHLLGSIIVSQIQLAAMRQAQLPAEQRVPFSLFVDEVQNFITPAFNTILSEARKQKLRLTIAHQFVSQLPQETQKAIFGNVGTMVFFTLSPDDLGAARHELGSFTPEDVANLPKYHALCRPITAAKDTFSFVTLPPPARTGRDLTQTVIAQTRRMYGTGNDAPETPQPIAQPVADPVPVPSPVTEVKTIIKQPASARPLSFATNPEKILHYLQPAEYLSQPQIIALTGLQASNASTALKKLVDTGQIKSLDDRRPKIYFVGRNCNPTTHNLLVRDLFVKILASNFAIRQIRFNETLKDLNPDLSVEFLAEDGTPLPCYFELDRGTEGVGELIKKAERYASLPYRAMVGFIFEREGDMRATMSKINYPFIVYSVLESFTSLKDNAFETTFKTSLDSAAPASSQLPFFGS